jgi:DNA-binding GntR family transcriptional regulator
VLALDDVWHRKLLEACPNPVLLELIGQFTLRTRRYDLALMRERRHIDRAVQDHEDILAALRAGDLKRACSALRRNMESGRAPIIAWLKERQTK